MCGACAVRVRCVCGARNVLPGPMGQADLLFPRTVDEVELGAVVRAHIIVP